MHIIRKHLVNNCLSPFEASKGIIDHYLVLQISSCDVNMFINLPTAGRNSAIHTCLRIDFLSTASGCYM